MNPLERLRYHVTGAIERGEAEPIVEVTSPYLRDEWARTEHKEGLHDAEPSAECRWCICEFGGGCTEFRKEGYRFCPAHLARINAANERDAR